MYDFKQLTGSTKYRQWKEWKKDEFIVGEVIRLQPNKKNPRHQDIVIKVMEVGFPSDSIHVGDVFTVNGNTGIQKAIDTGIESDDIVKVVYGGTAIVKTGQWAGAKTHVTEVFIAPKKTVDNEDSGL